MNEEADITFNSQNFSGNAYSQIPVTADEEREYSQFNQQRGLASSLIEDQLNQINAEVDKRNAEAMSGNTIMPDGMNPNPIGSNYSQIEDYYKTLAHVESKGKYDAKNKSGAYGKYQFMPGTEKEVADKLGLTIQQARTPSNQEKMIRRFTKDNIDGLRRNGIPVTKETMWWAHNQGLGGAINLYKGGKVSAKNLASNGGNSSAEYIAKWKKIFGNGSSTPSGLAAS